MVTDSIAKAPIQSAPNARDLCKKKRARTAKLKQSKLDVRREQWLSQGVVKKNMGCKEEINTIGGTAPIQTRKEMNNDNDNNLLENLDTRRRGEENDGYSDFPGLPSFSPISLSSILGSNDSGLLSTGSSSSSSNSSEGCCSWSIITEEDRDGDENDGCLDDWEAFADALAANEKQHSNSNNDNLSSKQVAQSVPPCETGIGNYSKNRRAWSPGDASRPQGLPNLPKQLSLPNSDLHYGCGGILSAPKSCPICYEDLDITDSSFLPCSCGFKLCLFCHKRILEEDGRCPGCRKVYEHNFVDSDASVNGGSLRIQVVVATHSASISTRS